MKTKHQSKFVLSTLLSIVTPNVILLAVAALLGCGVGSASAATQTWVGSSTTDFFTGSAWVSGVAPGDGTGVGAGDEAVFSTAENGNNPNLSTSGTIAGLYFSAGPYTLTSSAGAVLTVTGTNGGIISSATSPTSAIASFYAGTTTISAALNLVNGGGPSGMNIYQESGGILTLGGIISGPNINHVVNFNLYSAANGDGTIYLSNTSNTFSSATIVINDGIVEIAGNGSLGSTGNTLDIGGNTGGSGGTLEFTGTAPNSGVSARVFNTGTNGATLNASGSVPFQFTSTGAMGFNTVGASGTGARALTLTGSNTGNNEVALVIGDNPTAGLTSLVKSGAGTWQLTNGANTYSGGTTISAGILDFANGALGSSGNITVNGGTLQWAGGNTQDISSRLTLQSSGAATLDTNGNNVTLATGFGGSTSSALTKAGNGTLTLSAANTYTGATTVNAGTLSLTGGLGSTTLAVGGGAFAYSNAAGNATQSFTTTNINAGASAIDNTVGGDTLNLGTLSRSAGGTVDFTTTTGTINTSSTTFILNGILVSAASNGTAFATVGGGASWATLSGSSIVPLPTASYVSGTASGAYSGGSATTGTDNVDVTNGNTINFDYVGSLRFNGPNINLSTPSGDHNTIVQGAILITGSGTGSSFTGPSNSLIRPLGTEMVVIDYGSFNLNVPVSNNSGACTLTLSGTGTTTLSGSSTYTGATIVNAGTVIVTGSLSGSTSASVASGATLELDGSLNQAATTTVNGGSLQGTGSLGAITANGSSTIAPGLTVANSTSTTGTLTATAGNVALSSNSVFAIRLGLVSGSTGDALAVNSGTVTLNGASLQLTLYGLINSASNINDVYPIISSSGGITGQFAQGNSISTNGFTFNILYNENAAGTGAGTDVDLVLTAIPEPGTWAMIISGTGMLCVFQRRRRN